MMPVLGTEIGKKIFGSLSSKITSNDNIQVERNGLRLGWSVTAMLAAIGLGLYISSIVTPLDARLSRLEEIKIEYHKSVEILTDKIERLDIVHRKIMEDLHDDQNRDESRLLSLENRTMLNAQDVKSLMEQKARYDSIISQLIEQRARNQ